MFLVVFPQSLRQMPKQYINYATTAPYKSYAVHQSPILHTMPHSLDTARVVVSTTQKSAVTSRKYRAIEKHLLNYRNEHTAGTCRVSLFLTNHHMPRAIRAKTRTQCEKTHPQTTQNDFLRSTVL